MGVSIQGIIMVLVQGKHSLSRYFDPRQIHGLEQMRASPSLIEHRQ